MDDRYQATTNTASSFIHHHARLTAIFPGLPRWAGNRKVKPIWILLKQETVSGSGISWAICKYAPCSRQTNHASTPPLCFFLRQATNTSLAQIWGMRQLTSWGRSLVILIVSTCLQNLGISVNLITVREMSENFTLLREWLYCLLSEGTYSCFYYAYRAKWRHIINGHDAITILWV